MSMARNAPFGTDDTPEIEVKIIGSKRVQVLRDKKKKHGNPLLAPLPDSPSLLTQPLYKEYENLSSSHIKQGYTTTDQHERAKLVPSQTAQADKSNSQLHGTNNLKVSSKVLPPISRSSTSSDGSGGGQSSILGEDPTISNQLHKILKKYDAKKFKDMYVELVGYDRNLTGYVNQSQLNLVCLRHQLPLSGSTLQIMFSRFASTEDEESINYEKLLQFLSAAQQNKPVKQSTLSATVEKFVGGGGDSTSSSQKSKAGSQTAPELRIRQKSHMQENILMSPGSGLISPSISLPQTTSTIDGLKPESPVARHRTGSFSDREAAKLVHLLENQFTALEADELDLQAVRNTFEEVDRQRAGMLSRKQLEDVVVKHRLPIQGSLMEKLLKRCEVEAGLFSWKTLVDFLERVKPLEIPSKQKQGVKRPGTWPRNKHNAEKFLPPSASPEVPKPPPWETRKPLERLEKRPTQLSPEEPQIERISHTGNTSTPSSSGGLSHGTNEDEMSPRNSLEDSQRDLDKLILAAREKQRARGKAAMHLEEGEDWDQRFLHLAKALFNCDELGSGFLELLEAKRLVRNYNLIYNLGFEDARIENTLTQCSADGKVALEPLIQSLRVKL